ncbi:hypothetical protein A2U01_0077027, partial [Trifolium medium]|nr:hypothetical protein [Trifolium medium]
GVVDAMLDRFGLPFRVSGVAIRTSTEERGCRLAFFLGA